MMNGYIKIEQSPPLQGEAELVGAKNAVLVIMASLLLTSGKSRLMNVPCSTDVLHMIKLLKELGAHVTFVSEEHFLEVDTTGVNRWTVSAEIMKKMRASILVMGSLLSRFGYCDVALPGGCVIGERPIDYHLKNFEKMGALIDINGEFLQARTPNKLVGQRLVLAYPSVGATENLIMLATLAQGTTEIINAALEPEVLDFITVLKKMGASIEIELPATIIVEGVNNLVPIEHTIMMDRLEAGSLLLATAATGGEIYLPQAQADMLDVLLLKLEEMGHKIIADSTKQGIRLKATKYPRAVSFKTGPYPSFPTDLQAPMMVLQCLASGTSVIEETVYENRLLHVRELQKMGAQIQVNYNKAIINGVEELYGAPVIASDIRASCALVIAGLVATGKTIMTGIKHWQRGYETLEKKLITLGAYLHVELSDKDQPSLTQVTDSLLEEAGV